MSPERLRAAEASRPHCIYPGCTNGPSEAGGNHYLERVNPKGEPFEGACSEHFEAVVLDREPDTEEGER